MDASRVKVNQIGDKRLNKKGENDSKEPTQELDIP